MAKTATQHSLSNITHTHHIIIFSFQTLPPPPQYRIAKAPHVRLLGRSYILPFGHQNYLLPGKHTKKCQFLVQPKNPVPKIDRSVVIYCISPSQFVPRCRTMQDLKHYYVACCMHAILNLAASSQSYGMVYRKHSAT